MEKPQIDSFRYRMQVLESRLQTIDTRSQIIDNRMMRTGEEYCKDLFKCFFCNTKIIPKLIRGLEKVYENLTELFVF